MKLLYMKTDILEDKHLFEKGMNLISLDRRKKIEQMKNPETAHLSLAAGLLSRIALEKSGLLSYLNEVHYEKNGKPCLNKDNFYFNLSHSGSYAVCAYSNTDLGIDLQKIKSNLPKQTKRILSDEEKEFLSSLDEKEQIPFFYRLWSMKESLIKWDGRGLRLNLNEISFIQQNKITDSIFFENKKLFFTESELFFPEYTLYICASSKQNLETEERIDRKFLIKY